MAVQGPIIIVEDDVNDAEVIIAAIKEIGIRNEAKLFSGAKEAYDYLMTTSDKPLIIICDVRMPVLDGLSFLKQIAGNQYLRLKAIPFVFFTGLYMQSMVNEAFRIGVQGFYQKAGGYEKIKEQLYSILTYWHHSLHPKHEA